MPNVDFQSENQPLIQVEGNGGADDWGRYTMSGEQGFRVS